MRGAIIDLGSGPDRAAVGDAVEVPDHLLRATLRAAMRVTRQKVPLPLALSRRTAWLVRSTLAEGGEPCPTAH